MSLPLNQHHFSLVHEAAAHLCDCVSEVNHPQLLSRQLC